jgi:hypothetical protein
VPRTCDTKEVKKEEEEEEEEETNTSVFQILGGAKSPQKTDKDCYSGWGRNLQ